MTNISEVRKAFEAMLQHAPAETVSAARFLRESLHEAELAPDLPIVRRLLADDMARFQSFAAFKGHGRAADGKGIEER